MKRLAKISISLLASLLGFSLPVSAHLMTWHPTPLKSAHHLVLTFLDSLRWSDYVSVIFDLLLVCWLSILSFCIYKRNTYNTTNYAKSNPQAGALAFDNVQKASLPVKPNYKLLRHLGSCETTIQRIINRLIYLIRYRSFNNPQNLEAQATNSRPSENEGSDKETNGEGIMHETSEDLTALKADLQNLREFISRIKENHDLDSKEINDSLRQISISQSSHHQQLVKIFESLKLQDDKFIKFRDDYYSQKSPSQVSENVSQSIRDVHASETIFSQRSELSRESGDDSTAALIEEYRHAFFENDRSALRIMTSKQLVITQESEDSFMKPMGIATRLVAVKNGGSYMLIHRNGRHWLVPDFRVLNSFTTKQVAKGIFIYDRENISSAELRRPAEVHEVNGLWEVISMGLIAVPT